RPLELLSVLLDHIRGQGREALRSQAHHEEGACYNVVNLPMLVPEGTVQVQINELAFIVQHQPHRIVRDRRRQCLRPRSEERPCALPLSGRLNCSVYFWIISGGRDAKLSGPRPTTRKVPATMS